MAIQDPWRTRGFLGVAFALVALLLTSASLAQKPEQGASFSLTGGPGPQHSFTYQGRLSSNGVPADGHYDFVVTVWDAAELGIQLATCDNVGSVDNLDNQPVERGLFTFYLVCGGWNGDVFTGGQRFLEIQVRPHGEVAYTTLPRQAIAPTPYAWSLYPQAKIEGPTSGSAFGDATLNINNTAPPQSSGPALYVQTASGSAVRADSGGQAVYGYTYYNHAIVGRSVQSVAGDFQSDEGYGLTVNSDGTDHWDHAGYFTSDMGYGIYVNSTGNNGLRAIGGSTTLDGVWQPGGPVGVAGLSETRSGVYGSSRDANGVYGSSRVSDGMRGQTEGYLTAGVSGQGMGPDFNYGVYGTSAWGRGVMGVDGGSNPDDSYALFAQGDLYVSDDLFVAGTKSAVVETDGGDERLMYCIESPEVWFEDLGNARLVDGQATVTIEPVFAQTVYLAAADYHVQITPVSSEPVIVYVTAKTPTGFTVAGVKLDGTPATCTFDYRISARRLGYEDLRMQRMADLGKEP